MKSMHPSRSGLLRLCLAIVLCDCAAGEAADAPAHDSAATLTSIGQVRTLSRADFHRGRPVRLAGTVTLVDPSHRRIVLQDSADAMVWYSDEAPDVGLLGKRVLLECDSG